MADHMSSEHLIGCVGMRTVIGEGAWELRFPLDLRDVPRDPRHMLLAWNFFAKDPDAIQSIATRNYIKTVSHYGRWYQTPSPPGGLGRQSPVAKG